MEHFEAKPLVHLKSSGWPGEGAAAGRAPGQPNVPHERKPSLEAELGNGCDSERLEQQKIETGRWTRGKRLA